MVNADKRTWHEAESRRDGTRRCSSSSCLHFKAKINRTRIVWDQLNMVYVDYMQRFIQFFREDFVGERLNYVVAYILKKKMY